MSNIVNWLAAISNEDGGNMSLGSLRTLNMIRMEVNKNETEYKKLMEEKIKYQIEAEGQRIIIYNLKKKLEIYEPS